MDKGTVIIEGNNCPDMTQAQIAPEGLKNSRGLYSIVKNELS